MHSPTVEVSEWSVYPIHSGAGEGLGVYRFIGTGEDQGKRMPWSLVLKAFEAPAQGGGVGDWNYWKREAMAYRSGLLDDLPGGTAAPRCLGVEELAVPGSLRADCPALGAVQRCLPRGTLLTGRSMAEHQLAAGVGGRQRSSYGPPPASARTPACPACVP